MYQSDLKNIDVLSRVIPLIAIIFASYLATGCSLQTTSTGEGDLSRAIAREQESRLTQEDVTIPPSSEAQYEFMRGELAFASEEFDKALAHYQRAATVEQSPAPLLRRRLAQIYMRKGQLNEALEQIEAIGNSADSDPELLELRAGILATLKKFDGAVAAYRKLIQLPSDKPREEAHILLASLLAENNDLVGARNVLTELLNRAPDSIFAHYYMGRIGEMSGDLDLAEKSYQQALTLSPDTESIKLDLARLYGLKKNFEQGKQLVEEVLRNNPNSAPAHQLLGQLLLGNNQIDDALKQFEKLKSIERNPIETRLKIALIKLERRDFSGAETELTLVLADSPKNAAAHYYLALAFAGQSKVNEAIIELRHISSGERFFRESRLLGTYLLRQERRFAEALEVLSEVVTSDSSESKLLNLLASLQRDAGKVQDSIVTMKRLVELEPQNDQYLFSLAVLLDESDRKTEALATMRKCIEINPKNGQALNYLGYTLAEIGSDLNEAESLIKQALAIEPNNGYYIDSLGWTYYKMGRLNDAVRELERAVALVSSDAVLLEHLAIVLEKFGNYARAKTIASQGLSAAPTSDDADVAERLRQLIEKIERIAPSQTTTTEKTVEKQ